MAARPAGRRRLVDLVAAVLIAADVVRAVAVARGTGFFTDDLKDFQLVRADGFGTQLLTTTVFGHFSPAIDLVNWLMTRHLPVGRGPTMAVEAVALAVALVALYRVMTALAGPRWWTAVLTWAAGWSLVVTSDVSWWAASLMLLVPGALGLCMLDGFLCFERTGHRRALAWALVAYVGGLAFDEATAAFAVVAVLMVALFQPAGTGAAGAWRAVASRWRTWAAFAAPTAIDLGWRFSHPRTYHFTGSAGLHALVQYVGIAWSQGFTASLFGLSYTSPTVLTVPPLLVIAGQELMAVVVVVTVVRRPRAVRAWLAFALVALGLIVSTGATHLNQFELPVFGIAYYPLLFGLLFFYVLLAAAVGGARLPGGPARPVTAAGPDAAGPDAAGPHDTGPQAAGRVATLLARLRPALVTAGVLAAVGYGALVWQNTSSDDENYNARQAGLYESNFVANWHEAGARHPSAFVWDTVPPFPLNLDFGLPFVAASHELTLFAPGARFGTGVRGGFVLEQNGTLAPARFAPTAALVLPAVRGDAAGCLATGAVGHTFAVAVAGGRRQTGPDGRFFLEVDERSPPVGSVRVLGAATLPEGPGGSGGSGGPGGSGPEVVALDVGPVARVAFRLAARSRLCMAAAWIGQPVPAGAVLVPSAG